MLNGSVFGQRFYAARNPPWTVHKPTMGLRANGQIKGKYGHGDQQYVREAFALEGIQNYGKTGFVMMNGKLTPRPAYEMQQHLQAAYRKYPEIAVGPEARKRRIEQMRADAHRSSVARWQAGTVAEFLPGGAFEQPVTVYPR